MITVHEVTPTISTGIYAAGDALGGLLEFENVLSAFKSDGEIVGAVLIDDDTENAAIDLLLFDREITPTTDNDELDVSDADLAHLIGKISFPAASYLSAKDNGICALELAVPIVLVDGGTSLFGLLKVEGTPTYTAATDITIKLFVKS
jgi:hypothetical protein